MAGWVWLRAKPWDAELLLFEIDILGGLSHCASLDHDALKKCFLSHFYSLLSTVFHLSPSLGTPGEL